MYTFSTISLALLAITSTTLAQSTVSDVSQIGDGQIQAPTDTASASVSLSSAADPALSSAVTTSTGSYENPFTIYTTQTNSLGVITGQPSVVTSQPEVVTSQPPSATLPSVSGYYYGNGTAAVSDTTAAMPSTLETSTVTKSASGSGSSGASGSSSASASFAQSTGAAVSTKVVGTGLGLVALALGFSML